MLHTVRVSPHGQKPAQEGECITDIVKFLLFVTTSQSASLLKCWLHCLKSDVWSAFQLPTFDHACSCDTEICQDKQQNTIDKYNTSDQQVHVRLFYLLIDRCICTINQKKKDGEIDARMPRKTPAWSCQCEPEQWGARSRGAHNTSAIIAGIVSMLQAQPIIC